MKPFRDSAVWLVAGEAGVAKVYREDSPAFYLVTYATLAGVYVAAAAVPSVWVPLQLVGATAGEWLGPCGWGGVGLTADGCCGWLGCVGRGDSWGCSFAACCAFCKEEGMG